VVVLLLLMFVPLPLLLVLVLLLRLLLQLSANESQQSVLVTGLRLATSYPNILLTDDALSPNTAVVANAVVATTAMHVVDVVVAVAVAVEVSRRLSFHNGIDC
jgi:hypothetical protein